MKNYSSRITPIFCKLWIFTALSGRLNTVWILTGLLCVWLRGAPIHYEYPYCLFSVGSYSNKSFVFVVYVVCCICCRDPSLFCPKIYYVILVIFFTIKHIPVKTSGTVKQCYKDTKAYIILAFCHTDLHT